MKPKYFPLLFALISTHTLAEDHHINLNFGLGDADYDSESNDVDAVNNLSLAYRKKITELLDLKVGIHSGNTNTLIDMEDSDSNSVEEDLDYEALSLSAHIEYPFTRKMGLQGSLGVNYHDVTVSFDSVDFIEETGTGYFLEFGGYYRFTNNFSLHLVWQTLDLGDVDIRSTNFGIGYQF